MLESIGSAGVSGLVIISIGLIARSLGVFLSLIGSELNWKERVFCQMSFLPKATVQAAILNGEQSDSLNETEIHRRNYPSISA